LKFYASVRLEIRGKGAIKEGQDIVGNRTKVRVVKNKMAPPFKEAEFDIVYGEGISRYGDILDMGVEVGVIDKSGSWYSYQGERIGQGRENVKKFFQDKPEIYDAVLLKVREKLLASSTDIPRPRADKKEENEPDDESMSE